MRVGSANLQLPLRVATGADPRKASSALACGLAF